MQVLNSSMDAVRRKLAPIRGIPTKTGGMVDPNSDLKEMFELMESIPTAPKKLLDGFLGWARGDDDPDWKKGKNGVKKK
jgi:histone-lysine N-methyltransferase SETD3